MSRKYIQSKNSSNESESLIKWMHRRTNHQNRNCIIAVVGNPGSGKSYACLRIAEKKTQIRNKNKKYDIRNCSRTSMDFMERLNSGELKRGDVVILEEVGVNLSAREWQSRINKIMNYIFQVFRTDNLVVLLNLPDLRMLDVNTQRLLHGVLVMKGINHEKKESYGSFKIRQHNFELHKDYWKFLRVKLNGKVKKIKLHTFKKPSEDLIKIYEERRKEFSDKLKEDVYAETKKQFEKQLIESAGGTGQQFTPKQLRIYEIYHSGVTKLVEIGKILDLSHVTIKSQMTKMDNKNPNWRKLNIKTDN